MSFDQIPLTASTPPGSAAILPPLGALEILAASPEAFVFLDGELRLRFVNAAAQAHFGRDLTSLYGRPPWDAWPSAIGARGEPHYRRAMAEHTSVTFTDRPEDDGRDADLEVTAYPAAGGLALFIRDITAHRLALEETRRVATTMREESVELSQRNQELIRINASLSYARHEAEQGRERMRAVMDSVGDVAFWLDADWRWIFANEAGRLLLSRLGRPGDPTGRRLWETLPQLLGSRFELELRRAVTERRIIEFEELLPETGEWMESRVVPVDDGSVLLFARDVTERRRQLETLRQSEARYHTLVEASAQIVWTADAEGQVTDIPAWREITGQSVEEVAGQRWMEAIHPLDAGSVETIFSTALATRSNYEVQYRIRLRDGSYRWYRARGGPVLGADGSVREWVGFVNEVDRMVRRDEGHHFLVQASAALTETLDEEATLDTLARLAVDQLADGAMITLVREDGRCEHVATRSRDGKTAEYAAETERLYPLPADAPSGYPRAIRTGEPELMSAAAFDPENLPKIAADATHLARLIALDMYSGMAIPLVARGNILGAITLVLHGPEHRRSFDASDLAIATELGRRAALALDNARLFDAERQARRDVALGAERLRAVADAARAFAEVATDPVQVSEALAEILMRRVGDSCVVRLLDRHEGTLGVVATRHRSAPTERTIDAVARAVRYRVTEGLTSRLLVPGAYVHLAGNELRQQRDAMSPADRDVVDVSDICALLGVALRTDGQVVGTAYLAREGEERAYDAGDIALVQELADRAALVLERARLFAAERSARDEAEHAAELTRRLQEITASFARTITVSEVAATTLSHGLDALSAQSGAVYLMNESRDALELVRREGIPDDTLRGFQTVPLDAAMPVADAVRRGEIVCLGDRAAMTREYPGIAGDTGRMGADAWAAVPLLHAGRTIGAIALGFSGAREFAPREQALLDALGRHCAQAMERARLLDAERDARDDAERANQAKSDLLAKVSHETRQPVHASIGWVDTMEMELQGPITEQQREALRRIKQNQLRLLNVLNDLLDMSRIEAGKLELHVRDIVVGDVVDAVESAVAPQIRNKGIRFDFERPMPGLRVRADVDQLIGILTNLLSNAAKFTPEGGQVNVACEAADGIVRLRVRDTGIGIPGELIERVFEPFFQVDSGFTRTSVGTGLGLAISREAARAMGGDVTVTSEVGKGSTFTVTLQRVGG